MTENEIGEAVLGAAMKVHSAVGPGLLESVYETCLTHELRKQGFDVQRQVALPVEYDGNVSIPVSALISWLRKRWLLR